MYIKYICIYSNLMKLRFSRFEVFDERHMLTYIKENNDLEHVHGLYPEFLYPFPLILTCCFKAPRALYISSDFVAFILFF